jgi:hypothetical protein
MLDKFIHRLSLGDGIVLLGDNNEYGTITLSQIVTDKLHGYKKVKFDLLFQTGSGVIDGVVQYAIVALTPEEIREMTVPATITNGQGKLQLLALGIYNQVEAMIMQAGDEVMHNRSKWVSSIANNVWEPGVLGWDNLGQI